MVRCNREAAVPMRLRRVLLRCHGAFRFLSANPAGALRVEVIFFKWIAAGSLKVEVTKYALDEAAEVHKRFEARKTTGKVVLIP
jgi:NADPH:quinone reductase-like Zn-dependent oxidoreductase